MKGSLACYTSSNIAIWHGLKLLSTLINTWPSNQELETLNHVGQGGSKQLSLVQKHFLEKVDHHLSITSLSIMDCVLKYFVIVCFVFVTLWKIGNSLQNKLPVLKNYILKKEMFNNTVPWISYSTTLRRSLQKNII